MSIPTSRTKESANILIDEKLCVGCGLCVEVCKGFNLSLQKGKVISINSVYGCIACGHCMTICPKEAIKISGRCLTSEDLFSLSKETKPPAYEEILNLFQQRRSIREFRAVPVEKEILEKVIEAAQTCPMGLPPSDVNLIVFDSPAKVRKFAEDFCEYLKGIKWIVSEWFLRLMRPFWGKANNELFRGFVRPTINLYLDNMEKGINLVNYDAPAALYFYGSPYSDPADPIVAATYAMIAAESLGLGTCMLGAVHPLIQNGKAAQKFRNSYGIRYKSREGLFVIMGYPKVEYDKGIRRTFASIDVR
ncbi:nitroreductase [Desulfosporosinus sp. HMP52]|uniref:nitroreductase family protein n=1 Tax=Desulfosporosinus sp. HMP52 TaxID=1487923 RepID=UPI00051FB1CC|nr:nitroreductase family protein [Desulfosporosinus sp. HMP52]KGK82444.1 nitroreductase [Desulfosporosinus sp. HMP52]